MDYARLAQSATRMLAKFGQSVTLTKFEQGTENPSTGVVTPATTTDTTPVGVILDFPYRAFGESLEVKGSTNKAEKRLLLSASSVVNPGDQVTMADGNTFVVNTSKLLAPAGTRVLYDLWISQ